MDRAKVMIPFFPQTASFSTKFLQKYMGTHQQSLLPMFSTGGALLSTASFATIFRTKLTPHAYIVHDFSSFFLFYSKFLFRQQELDTNRIIHHLPYFILLKRFQLALHCGHPESCRSFRFSISTYDSGGSAGIEV